MANIALKHPCRRDSIQIFWGAPDQCPLQTEDEPARPRVIYFMWKTQNDTSWIQTGPMTCSDLPHEVYPLTQCQDWLFAMALHPAPCSYIFLVGPPASHEGPHGAEGSTRLEALPSGCSEFAALYPWCPVSPSNAMKRGTTLARLRAVLLLKKNPS